MFTKKGIAFLMVGIISIFGASIILAQNKTLERDFEPIIIPGSFFSIFTGAPIDDLFLYAYRSNSAMFEQIPFQFDERGTDGSFFTQDDGLLDDNDELAFMAKDAGDKAPVLPGPWIDNLESQIFQRYEIEITDPLDGSKAWVYLYRSNTLTLDPNITDYVAYFASMTTNPGEDTVRTLFYQIVHSTNGFPKDLTIPQSAGGNGEDILDILKFRAEASFIINIFINEENIVFDEQESDSVRIKDGLVRVIRELEATLKINLGFFGTLTLAFSTPPAFYSPYSASVDIAIPELAGATVSTGRMSFDLNESTFVRKFVSANNPEPGFNIDGIPSEVPNTTIDNLLPDNNWIYINGEQGTIVHMFPLEPTVGGARQLYYKDDSAVDNNDTGDKKSFGDTGILLTNGVVPPFTLSYKGYFLNKNQPSSIGSQIALFEQNPVTVDTLSQRFPDVVPVELVSFTATVEKNDVHLIWITASETNNFGFDIERRVHDAGQWSKIAFEPGHGTTVESIRYDYYDRNLQSNGYDYRLKQIDTDGSFEYSKPVTAVVGFPQTFTLHQNFPNPFNPSTEIQYQLPSRGGEFLKKNRTTLKIYNLLGKEVRTLIDEEQSPGYYKVIWDGKDSLGRKVTTGVYIYRLQSGNFVDAKKMVLVQ